MPAFGIASVNVFGLKAPEEIEGFTLNDSTNFEKIKPGDGYGLDYSQSGWKLDVFIYDLKRAAIPDDAKSAIVRAEFERVRADAFLAQPRGLYAQVYLRRNFTIDDASQAHALPVRGVSSDPRRRQAPGRLSLRHLLEQQVRQAPPHDARRQQHRGRRAQIRHRLDSGAVGPAAPPAPSRSARAEAAAPRRSPAHTAAPAHRPPPPRRPRFKCPENYICETR